MRLTSILRTFRPRLEQLENREVLSAKFHLAVMGDSLSAPYSGKPYGAAGDKSWTEQLQALRSKYVVIHNEAFAGATSDSLIHGQPDHPTPQATAVANLVARHVVSDVYIMIGANDVAANMPHLISTSDVQYFVSTFVTSVVGNIEAAVQQIAAAGPVSFVISNIPDVTVTPGFQASIPGSMFPVMDYVVDQAIALANQQLKDFAFAHHIVIVDLFSETHLATQPIRIGGASVNNLYAPDYFHPNTVAQGILANTILVALQRGHPNRHVVGPRLTDREILTAAGISPQVRGTTYFDVNPFVLGRSVRHTVAWWRVHAANAAAE